MQPSKASRIASFLNCQSSEAHARLLALAFAAFLAIALPISAAQEKQSGEIVANLATGRVVFCVTHDAIIVAATSGGGEVGSRPPTVLPVSPGRVGVLLGAIEWTVPSTGKTTRFDADLPSVASDALRRPVQSTPGPAPKSLDQPSEIEDIGVGMLEEIRPMVEQIHHKLDLAPDEPLVELILADYVQNYGPEIWTLQYRVRQENLGSDFWQTRILRPAYFQLYPPEKGQAHTFIEADYPANVPRLDLAEHVARRDPQFERIGNSSRESSQAFDLHCGREQHEGALLARLGLHARRYSARGRRQSEPGHGATRYGSRLSMDPRAAEAHSRGQSAQRTRCALAAPARTSPAIIPRHTFALS